SASARRGRHFRARRCGLRNRRRRPGRSRDRVMSATAADQANQNLVDRMIAEGALWSPPLIRAFRATPRHEFVDRVFQYQRKHNRWRERITRDPGPEELELVY